MPIEEILAAKEQRAAKIKQMQAETKETLISFSMNIPGREKNSHLVRFAFRKGCEQLHTLLGSFDIEYLEDTAAGPQGYFCTPLNTAGVKVITQMIEEGNPVGRLYDMDVLDCSGKKLSRANPRKCLICDKPAVVCAKAGNHSIQQARDAADCLLREFAAEQLASFAECSLIEEVNLTPKPGLVDKSNSGAHADMNVLTFEKSADALLPYFKNAVLLGMSQEDCMEALQAAGLEAEKNMLEVTGGVNTHKGAIYAFGIMLAAMGSKLAFGSEIFSTAAALAYAGKVYDTPSHGNEVRKKIKRCGPRQEALEGFPDAISAYNVLCETEEPLRALLWLIASVPDTNLLYRGGVEGLTYAQEEAKKCLHLPAEELRSAIIRMDKAFTEKNLSPGGCADLLALAIFLRKTEQIWLEEEE